MTQKKYRIVELVSDVLPNHEAHVEQSMNTAAALARQGHDVTVLCPLLAGRQPVTARSLRAFYTTSGNFRLCQRPYHGPVSEPLRTLVFAARMMKDARVRSADVVLTRRVEALFMAACTGTPVLFDHYRPLPQQFPAFRPVLRWMMTRKSFIGALIHSNFACNAYDDLGLDSGKVVVARNGFNPEVMEPNLTKSQARDRLGLSHQQHLVVYSGRINHKKGLDQVLKLAALAPQVTFALVGSEGEGPIERAARKLPNLMIVPWLPFAQVAPWLYAADILLLPPSSAPLTKYGNCVLPLKIYGYLAAGRPILAPYSPDTAELLRDGETACLVAPDNPIAAHQALTKLLMDRDMANALGDGARRLAQNLTWDHRAQRIESLLDDRIGKRQMTGKVFHARAA